MKMPANKKLSTFTRNLRLTFGMFLVVAITFSFYVHSEKQIDRANALRLQSFLLADELRQSSDDLTNMVRTYIVTGEARYKQHFLEILDIRNGQKPRPLDYSNIYWDLVLSDDARPRANGEAISLLELMRQAEFMDEEFKLLEQAKTNSDELTNAEFKAMAMVESTTPATEENRHQAFGLVFGEAYHHNKAEIMRPIHDFYQMMDRRTLENVRTAKNMAKLVRITLIAFGLLFIYTLWLSYRALQATLGCSADELKQQMARLGRGDFSVTIPAQQNMQDSVLGWLSETQINLSRIDTERRLAELALSQSEKQFRIMFDQAPLGIAVIDSLTAHIYKINSMFAKIAGRPLSEMIDVDWVSITHPDDVQKDLDNMALLNAGKTTGFQMEKRYLRPDGSAIWINMTVASLDVEDKTQPRHLCMIEDISERKKSEIELNQYRNNLEELIEERTHALSVAKEAAEAANIAKSTFIATMSHELRTPLNAILGFSELMSLDTAITQKQKETLAIINRSGAHLLAMINDVLDISKIEAGRLELDIQTLNLVDFLNDISVMIDVRAVAKQLDFRLELAPDMAQFIKTDSEKLRQVLINLLGNAIKFTQHGSIVLRACTQSALDKMLLVVEIIDSGIGIPADKQDLLFKPFVQLVRLDSGLEGTGLGLSITKSLIELMGGQISVSSEFGVGSTFKIELPIALVNAADVAIAESFDTVKSLAPNQPAWRLLVVDDNADNRLLLVSLLTDMGFEVREAKNGHEAVCEFQAWQPHLIWMDMRMPVMDGYEATAKIRQLNDGDTVKIIAVTASAFIEQHKNIIEAGCDAVLHKPIHADEIFAALSKHLDVKFIYQETENSVDVPTMKITAEMVATLPSELRQQLHQAALKLDMEEIDAIIEKIRIIAPEIADGLNELAQGYQFEQIIQLIESAYSQ